MRTKYYNFKTKLCSFRISRAKSGWTAKVYSSSPKRWLNVLYPNGEKANRPKKRELQEYLLYAYGGK